MIQIHQGGLCRINVTLQHDLTERNEYIPLEIEIKLEMAPKEFETEGYQFIDELYRIFIIEILVCFLQHLSQQV